MSSNAVSPPIQDLLALFETYLTDVSFPQVDHQTLVAAAARVTAAQDTVNELEQARQRAASALSEEKGALLMTAQLALEYARVYAKGDDELFSVVSSIQLSTKPARKTRKKRKKPSTPESQLLLSKEEPEAGEEQTAA